MKHEEAELLLPDLRRGRLSRQVEEELTAHQAGCDDCRTLSETYDLLSSGLKAEAATFPAPHPPSEEMVSYALGAGNLGIEDLARIASHLRSCQQCAREVETIRKADEAARERIPPPLGRLFHTFASTQRPGLTAALAAGVVFLVLGYPAFLGVLELPRAERRADQLRGEKERVKSESEESMEALRAEMDQKLKGLRRSTAHPEPVELHFLTGPTRDGSSMETPKIRADGSNLYLALVPDLHTIPAGNEHCRLEILHEGRVVWSWEMASVQIRKNLASSQGSVILSIPSALLPPGLYDLRLARSGVPGAKPLFLKSFEVLP